MTRWDPFAVGTEEKTPAGYRFLVKDEKRRNCLMVTTIRGLIDAPRAAD